MVMTVEGSLNLALQRREQGRVRAASAASAASALSPTAQDDFIAAAGGGGGGGGAIKDIFSGTVGGLLQVAVGHPLDTIKTRMQTQVRAWCAGGVAGAADTAGADPAAPAAPAACRTR